MKLRQRLRFRLAQALTPRPPEHDRPFAALLRIESDPAHRALSFPELDAMIRDREADRQVVQVAIEAATEQLRSQVSPDHGEGAT
ncbi:hypothetical protein [Streptomyces sp. NPDC057552]|uniref:hypothetical protein n=1 Tax=Streptomyces sp. NPDC057552 TaxID=3350537 RepID=UPI0036B49922